MESSLRLIGCNKERFQKKIQANQEAGEPVEYAVFKSQREVDRQNYLGIYEAHMDRGGRYEDFAIRFPDEYAAADADGKAAGIQHSIPYEG